MPWGKKVIEAGGSRERERERETASQDKIDRGQLFQGRKEGIEGHACLAWNCLA
jgi:hypothetical protein